MLENITGSTSFRIDVRDAIANTKAAVGFFEVLDSEEFAKANRRNFEANSRQEVRKAAIAIVDRVVYSYQPKTSEPYYQRTYRLRKSIKTATGATSGGPETEGQIIIYSDPGVSPGKEGYGNEDKTYAAFFIDPVRFRTFLRPRGAVSENTYRDFFVHWERFMKNYAPKKAIAAIEQTIRTKMPRRLRSA